MNIKKTKEQWGKYSDRQQGMFIFTLILNLISLMCFTMNPVLIFNPYNHVFNNILTLIPINIVGIFCFTLSQLQYVFYFDEHMLYKKKEYKQDD